MFVVAFRDLFDNDLTELLPGIFDSLALLEELYVFLLVAETFFVFFAHPGQRDASALNELEQFFFLEFGHAAFQLKELESKL